MKIYHLLVTILVLGLTPLRAEAAEELTQTLQKGLFEEEANHNLPEAIRAYTAVLREFEPQQRLAATALFRLGECHRKLRQTNEAIAQYQRLVRDFSEH